MIALSSVSCSLTFWLDRHEEWRLLHRLSMLGSTWLVCNQSSNKSLYLDTTHGSLYCKQQAFIGTGWSLGKGQIATVGKSSHNPQWSLGMPSPKSKYPHVPKAARCSKTKIPLIGRLPLWWVAGAWLPWLLVTHSTIPRSWNGFNQYRIVPITI